MDSKRAGRPRFRWAAAGPGRASRRRAKRTISNQAPSVWRPPRGLQGLAAVPVGGGRTRAGSETTHRATRQRPCTTGLEGAGGPGRASRRRAKRTISNQAPPVWRPPRGLRGLAAVPVGGGRAWPGFETTHRATHQRPCTTGLEGAGGSGGPGRASRSTTPSEAACGDLAGGRARRRPENPWCHKPRPKVRTPRSTPGSGRPGGRRGARAR